LSSLRCRKGLHDGPFARTFSCPSLASRQRASEMVGLQYRLIAFAVTRKMGIRAARQSRCDVRRRARLYYISQARLRANLPSPIPSHAKPKLANHLECVTL